MMMMNGHIISGTSICVDYWLWTPEKKYHHFLTHLHADHTVNLRSTFCEKIYTSRFNAWLLRRWFDISPEYIVALDVGESHLLDDSQSDSCFCVTLLDANHCPGSVMFLFQGTFGNILYTGDFRYNPKVLETPMLRSLIENEAVDRLYLDNTFAAEHCEFPTRQEALKDVINIIKDHPDHNILLGVRKLGKEEVLRAIALEFKEKVCVSDEKLKILTKLGYERVFTTEFEDSRIFVKEIPHITPKFIDHLRATRGPVVTILLTALYAVAPPHEKHSAFTSDSEKGIYKVPYSDHSCHFELVEFVSKIKPKDLLPIVNCSVRNKTDLSSRGELNDEILLSSWQNSVIPKSIMILSRPSRGLSTVALAPKKSFTNSLKEHPVSYMTEDSSDTSGESVVEHPNNFQAFKVQMQEECKDNNNGIDNGTITDNPKEILHKNNCSPKMHKYQSIKGKISISKELTNASNTSAQNLSLVDEEEFFTTSDEDLTQLNITSERQYIKNKPDLRIVNVLENTDLTLESLHAKSKGVEESQSNHPTGRKKLVNFIQCTPPLKHRFRIFKKRPPTPNLKAEQKKLEEEEENESLESERSVSLIQNLTNTEVSGDSDVIRKSPNSVKEGIEDSQLDDNHPLDNRTDRLKNSDIIACTPPSEHTRTFFKKRLPNNLLLAEKTTIEEEESYGSENSGTETVDSFLCNLLQLQDLKGLSVNDNIQSAGSPAFELECDTSSTKSKDCVDIKFAEPVLKYKTSLSTKTGSTIRQKNTNLDIKYCENEIDVKDKPNFPCITENGGSKDIDGQYEPLEPFYDAMTNDSKKKNQHAKNCNGAQNLVTLNPSAKLHSSTTSNNNIFAPMPVKKLLTENIPISKASKQSSDFCSKDKLQKNSCIKEDSMKLKSLKHRIEERNSGLKRKSRPPLPTKKQIDPKISRNNFCVLNKSNSAQKGSVGNCSKDEIGRYISKDEEYQNSVLIRIFHPTTKKQGELTNYSSNLSHEKKISEQKVITEQSYDNGFLHNKNSSEKTVLCEDTLMYETGEQFDNDEKRNNSIRASIIMRIFRPQSYMSDPIEKQVISKNTSLLNSVKKVKKVNNKFNKNEKIKSVTSMFSPILHSHLHTKDVQKGGQCNDFVHSRYNDADTSVEYEHGSESTVSDLQDNCVTLKMFEILDQTNDRISKSRKNNPITSNNVRVSQKYEHLLVNEFPKNVLGKDFLSPIPLKKHKTSMTVSSSAQNKKTFPETSRTRYPLKRKENGTIRPLTESDKFMQENNQRSDRVISKEKYLDINAMMAVITPETQIERSNTSSKESTSFYEDLPKIYKCWKEQVEKLKKSCKKS